MGADCAGAGVMCDCPDPERVVEAVFENLNSDDPSAFEQMKDAKSTAVRWKRYS